jgi:predicted regulator of Ras-like GTPase activity (Roadblock/LC7/MglB family)
MEKVKAVSNGSTAVMHRVAPPQPPVPPAPVATWTAPTKVPTTPALTNPTAVLDQLVAVVDGVDAAILASVDGFGLARSNSMSDEASHPAMLAAAIGLAHQLVAMGGGNKLRQLVVDHDAGLLLVWPLGEHRVLAVLATTTVEQRLVRAFVHTHAAQLIGFAV